jgi:hypothetical protein
MLDSRRRSYEIDRMVRTTSAGGLVVFVFRAMADLIAVQNSAPSLSQIHLSSFTGPTQKDRTY